ncbi:hypothetical protein KIPB_010490, partial [Kipferlia bialata]
DIAQACDSSWERVIKAAAAVYTHVLVVSGNHEYYRVKYYANLTIDQCNARMEAVCSSLPNVHFLNMTSVVIEGVRFSGCTLWSALRGGSQVPHCLMDFKEILDFSKRRSRSLAPSINAYNSLHREHREFLEEILEEYPNTPSTPHVIVTHHGPLMDMNTMVAEAGAPDLSDGFVSDLSDLFETESAPCLWVSGHTHHRLRVQFNGVLSVANCHGYPGEAESAGYQSVVVDVPTPTQHEGDGVSKAECVSWYSE